MGDPVVQWQIISKEPDKHAAFYRAVFGWNISADNPLGYRAADTGSTKGIQGAFGRLRPRLMPSYNCSSR